LEEITTTMEKDKDIFQTERKRSLAILNTQVSDTCAMIWGTTAFISLESLQFSASVGKHENF